MNKYNIKKPPKHRRDEIKSELLWLLEDCNKHELPVDLFDIIDNMPNTIAMSYSELMDIFKIDYSLLINYFTTDDACVNFDPITKRYVIIFNDFLPWKTTSNRYRWNIAHEIGHVILGHNDKIFTATLNRTNISDICYDEFETEADYFAQLLLVPHAALWGCKKVTKEFIHDICQISWRASEQRYDEYKEWYRKIGKNDYDKRIYKLYYPFLYKKICNNCDAGIVQRAGKYCPICGNKDTLERGDGDIMKYPLLETHENGKLKECPICHNEETIIDGNYCQICGGYIINKCSNYNCENNNILPSNARFCPICGCNSTFYNAGFLKAWDYKDTLVFQDGFLSVPGGIDEELPFK